MAAEKDNGVLSDTEGSEKATREQLKKAHLQDADKPDASAHDPTYEAVTSTDTIGTAFEARGRLQKKRSYDEVEGVSAQDATTSTRQHTRKRSRDSTAEEDVLNNGQRKSHELERTGNEVADAHAEANASAKPPRPGTPEQGTDARSEPAVETLTSPKTKRSRLHSTDATEVTTTQEDLKKEEATKLPPGSAFGNASSASPFGALAGSKSPSAEAQTSASAFSSSAFGALAASSSSGFGALGKTTGGPGVGGGFGSGAKSPLNTKENDKPPSTGGFGGALGQQSAFSAAGSSGSGFGSSSSGFLSLGSKSASGFGSSLAGATGGSGFGSLGGGGLSSFASGKPTAPFGVSAKSAKPFGAKNDEDEDDGGDDEEDDRSGMKSPLSQEEEKQDERFYEQSLETGEEGEVTEFSCRSKLYNYAAVESGKKEWRERGIGVLKLNVKKPAPDDEDAKLTARLLIRADGSHRIMLNTPIKKELQFGDQCGEKPQGGNVLFSGTIDDKPDLALLQLKLKHINALELYDKIKDLQASM